MNYDKATHKLAGSLLERSNCYQKTDSRNLLFREMELVHVLSETHMQLFTEALDGTKEQLEH